jgi:molecular chaperone Hsp33
MTDSDTLLRFLFEGLPIRGLLVRLGATWRAAVEHAELSTGEERVLGRCMAAAALLAADMKRPGRLVLQIQGEGDLRLLVVQADEELHLRGMLRAVGEVSDDATLPALTDHGNLTVTLDPEGSDQRYQGVVPLEHDELTRCLEVYLRNSQQIPARLWIAVGDGAAGSDGNITALLLERIPGKTDDPDAWDRIGHLASTVSDPELSDLSFAELLHRLFHEEDLRVFDPRPVSFRCHCSRDRTASLLHSMGREELQAMLDAQETVEVRCDFCGRRYEFDAVDVEGLFSGDTVPGPRTVQ